MNTPGLFIMGAIVTLIVVAALSLLVYGAILDGRDVREGEAEAAERNDPAGGEMVTAPQGG